MCIKYVFVLTLFLILRIEELLERLDEKQRRLSCIGVEHVVLA